MPDVAAFITREGGDKDLSLKQDFQLVVANSIQLPLGGVGGRPAAFMKAEWLH